MRKSKESKKMKDRIFFTILIVLFVLNHSFLLYHSSTEVNGKDEGVNAPKCSNVLEWAKIYDNYSYDSGKAVATDSDENIYVVGDCEPLFSDYDGLLVKYDKTGTLLWSKLWNYSIADSWFDIAIDSSNQIYIVGNVYEDSINACIVKLDEYGNEIWYETWGGYDHDRAFGVALDSKDNIYITGYTYGYDIFGFYELTAFLLKYSVYGDLEWSIIFPNSISLDVTVDSFDNIYIVGNYYGHLLIKFDGNGIQLWNKTWNGVGGANGFGVAVDSGDNIYVTGTNLTEVNSDIILLKYDSFGNLEWLNHWDSIFNRLDMGCDVAVDSKDNIYVFGRAENLTDTNTILLKYNATGDKQWMEQWGGSYHEFGYGIAVDESSDNVYATGEKNSYPEDNTDMFLLKYNSLNSSKDYIQNIVNNNSDHNDDDGNKKVEFIAGYNMFIFLAGVMIISAIVSKRRLKF